MNQIVDKTVEKSPSLKSSVNKATHRTHTKKHTKLTASSGLDRKVSKEVLMQQQQAYARPDSRKGTRVNSSPLDSDITELVDTSTISVSEMERERVISLMGIHIFIHTYIHTHTHTHMYIHT